MQHLKADKPGALSLTAALVRRHDVTTRADGRYELGSKTTNRHQTACIPRSAALTCE